MSVHKEVVRRRVPHLLCPVLVGAMLLPMLETDAGAALEVAERRSPLRFLAAAVGPAVATGIGLAIGSARTTAAALVYILGVLAVATMAGRAPGIAASVLSFLGLNFFFTPPRSTLSVRKFDDLIALFVFLCVGFVVSTLVSIGAAQRARAQRREYEARSLYAMSSRLLSGEDAGTVLAGLARHVRDLFNLDRCEIHTVGQDGNLELGASDGSRGDRRAVEVPLASGIRDVGRLVMYPGQRGLGEAERRVAVILARQLAASLERTALEREAREARAAAEAGRIRRALLGAVSHDFRTPLSAIKVAITGLLAGEEGSEAPVSRRDSSELLHTALEETERLERLVSNLLDLTRIRSGALAPERVPVRVEDLMDDVLAGLRAQTRHHRIAVLVREDVPKLDVDPVQFAQALRNVVENATKYAPAGSEIRLTAIRWKGAVELRVADRGPGISAAEREAVFEEFYRTGDGRIAGTGLGLAVAKAIVGAHEGQIWIEETPGGGATVGVRVPAAGA